MTGFPINHEDWGALALGLFMMRLSALLLILFFSVCAYPYIYKCKDANGQMVFSDRVTACSKTQSRDNTQPVVAPPVASTPEINKPTVPAGQGAGVEKATEHPNDEIAGENTQAVEDDSPNLDVFQTGHSNGGAKEKLGFVLLAIGGIISLIYGVILLVKAFQESVWWGLGYLFVPLVALIFVVVHWEAAKSPFLKSFLAIPFLVVGLFLVY